MTLSTVLGLLAGCASSTDRSAAVAPPRHRDDFRVDTGQWIVEQQPGGSVTIGDGRMVISDAGGCTVWFRERLDAPVRIVCEVLVSSQSRVSDMNFFWMATDAARTEDLFSTGHARTGKFATYDSLRTYYVGYGGNNNTTTRFRRYDGTGARPLLPEHDKTAPEFLLKPDHWYRIELIAAPGGRVQFVRDGEVIFDWTDPEPLTNGWFGFRTVQSRIEVRSFALYREAR
jgi:hypothetical protein